MLLTLALAGTTLANASPPRAAARPVASRPVTVRPVTPRPHPGSAISPAEAARIRNQVQEHHQMQRRANADGELSRREQAILTRDAAQVRHLIQTAKTN
ncbi:MAG: hypothetical protein ABIQ86_01755 [Steroidobacteraceae bacterium]